MVKQLINILLVEDNPGDARLISEMLNISGQIAYTVKIAEKISSAVSELSDNHFDIIILDLNLPDSSGLSTLDIVIKNTGGIIPVIVLTGINDEETGISAIEHGAEDYLVKGEVNPAQIMRSIRYSIERKRAEAANRESEERYRELVQNANSAIVRWKSDGTLTFFNEYAQKLFGYSAEEAIGKNVGIIVPDNDEDGKDLTTLVRDIVDSPDIYNYNINENICRNGRRVWMAWSNKPVFRDSKIIEILAIGSDITKRRQTEDALRKSENKYRTLIHTTPCVICTIKPDGTTIFVNNYIKTVTGYSAEEIIGQNWWDIFYPGELHTQIAGFLKTSKEGNVRGYEMMLRSRDGSNRTIQWDSFHKFGKDNELVEINCAGIDITARKLAETALRESERRLKEAQEMARVGDWEFDFVTQKITWSDQVYRMYGRDPLLGPPTPEEEALYYTLEQSAILQRTTQKAIDTGKKVDCEFNVSPNSEKTLVFAGTVRPVKDSAGNVIKIFGTLQDITERNKILEDLRTSLGEKKELIKEIYHRTKNNLQVIISMFTLQSIFSADEKLERVLKNMENRIRAMSLVHEKLYQSKDMSRLDLKDYLSDLVHNIMSDYVNSENKILITNKMEHMDVLIDTAIPCGLVFNELVSNVYKHAFPGDKKGELEISLVIDDTGLIELVVADNGDGKGMNPDIENKKSMGFQIISNIVEYQLQGKFKLNTASGVKWTISFKDNIYEERI